MTNHAPRDAVAEALENIRIWNPLVNAMLTVTGLSDTTATGPLAGVTVAYKDCIDVAGVRSTYGNARFKSHIAAEDSEVVRRLSAAGAICVGKTNLAEFCYGGTGENAHFGAALNPWEPSRITGGSSSGTGAAVAAGMCRIGIGTDTGGSVRIPSALCGLAGFKPTARRIPMAGTLPLSTALDSIGPLAASVRCCEIMDALLAGEAVPQRAATDLVDARLAVPTDVVLNDLDDAVASAFDAACRILTAAGARLRRIAIPEFSALPAIHSRGNLTAAEAWAWHRSLIDTQASAYDPRVVSRIKLGANMTAADLIDLVAARQRWIAGVQARMTGFDALLMPTVPQLAPPIEALVQDEAAYFRANGLMLRNPTLINFLDGCALTLPCQRPGDAPVGLMLAGVGGQDRHILSLGLAIESALDSAP